jgi:hypothetical protein
MDAGLGGNQGDADGFQLKRTSQILGFDPAREESSLREGGSEKHR